MPIRSVVSALAIICDLLIALTNIMQTETFSYPSAFSDSKRRPPTLQETQLSHEPARRLVVLRSK